MGVFDMSAHVVSDSEEGEGGDVTETMSEMQGEVESGDEEGYGWGV